MAASNGELTAQIIILTDQIQSLTNRVNIAEQNVTLQTQGGIKGRRLRDLRQEEALPKGPERWVVFQDVVGEVPGMGDHGQ